MSQSQSAGRRPASRGGGNNNNNRNRNPNSSGRGGPGGRPSGRGTGGQRKGNTSYHHGERGYRNNGRQGRGRSQNQQTFEDRPGMRDEDVLIAFMPYLKGNHPEAMKIHEEHQSGTSDQATFLKSAREFLVRESRNPASSSNVSSTINSQQTTDGSAAALTTSATTSTATTHGVPPAQVASSPSSHQQRPSQQQNNSSTLHATSNVHQELGHHNVAGASSRRDVSFQISAQMPHSSVFQSSAESSQPKEMTSSIVQNTAITNPTGFTSSQTPANYTNNLLPTHSGLTISSQQLPQYYSSNNVSNAQLASENKPQHDSSFDGLKMTSIERGLDALMDDGPSLLSQPMTSAMVSDNTVSLQNETFSSAALFPDSISNKPPPITPPRSVNRDPRQERPPNTPDQSALSSWSYSTPARETTSTSVDANHTPGTHSTPAAVDEQVSRKNDALEPGRTPVTARKEAPAPKRLWTYPEEQPGRIVVKGHSGEDNSIVLPLGPREELTAQWMMSLDYLKKYAIEKFGDNSNLETALSKITLGLFRRGCTENGSQASIVSKNIIGEYWKDPTKNAVCGKVPFYSPRTPGHVVFRLFWEDDPLYTLATGPSILVRMLETDFESSVRFILSNFKGKKSNPTSLSSLHSLANILETKITRPNDSAARTTWGCVQEARKVLEACALEHERTMARLSELEKEVDDLKTRVDLESEETGSMKDGSGETNTGTGEHSEAAIELKEKTRALMSGRASCERKWRDSQLAFAGILRAVVFNQSMAILLRRELILKMRIEYELWCPLSEEFAIPDEKAYIWLDAVRDLPQSLSVKDFERFSQARAKMQLRTLAFHPNTLGLEEILFPRGSNNQRALDPNAVSVFNKVSAAMGKSFQELFHDEGTVVRRRELVRQRTEDCVSQSGIFPPGTKVVIFGSSANGFGSPNSDLDMCLQLPEGATQDINGADAMAKLADFMTESGGMKDVDTARLSARIPIVMYRCPNPLPLAEDDSSIDQFIECDISMHNPLAVLNTSLLQTYSEITPLTRVLSLIIKRWAKARDINNPARHTLSSYGYIIMLLHFLTFHQRSGTGLVSAVARPEGDVRLRHPGVQRSNPVLPNLQWMDPSWPGSPRGTPYRELLALPRDIKPHPSEEGKRVNRYFYKPSSPNDLALLKATFAGNDLSLSILLASFFRYYAYEFDYKRYVVSLHSTAARGVVEREMKAELDGWRNYSAALTIEDPFETFYDVAHVLRGGYYHRIRREFAVAYSKIADAAAGRTGSWNKSNLQSMSGEEIIDWICEPIEKERMGEEEQT